MSAAGKNLKYLRKLRGWTQEEFAAKLQIKRSLLGAYEEERAEPRLEVLEAVGELFKLSLDELLLTEVGENKGGYMARRRAQKLAAGATEIPFVPVKAAAGYLAGYADPEYIDELNTFTLPMIGAGTYRAFEILGDSMLPTPSGSIIIGEMTMGIDDVKSNQTYIIVSRNDGIVYKRVVRNGKSKAKLTLVSDNTAYQPYSMNAADIVEIWKASFVISKANVQPRWDVHQLASVVSNLQDQVATLKNKMN